MFPWSAAALNPGKSLTQYSRLVWTQQDGLPQETIRAIAQTTDGYLWVGTDEGLARFDGYEFVVYDKTNGDLPGNSITALASAGDTLRTLVGLVADLEDEPQGLELGEVGSVGAGSPDLDLRIEDLDLTERPRNCLKRAQINTIGELVERTLDDLLNITNFGQKSLDEVLQKLDERGLALRVKD